MKRSVVLVGLLATALAAMSLPARADDSSSANPGRGARAFGHLQRCLSNLGLSSDQQAAIQSIITAAKPTLQADIQPLKADRQKLKSDLDSNADKSVIGQDVITARADRTKLKSDAQSVRDQILAKLSTDQQNQLKGCWQAGRGFGRRHSDGGSSNSGSSTGSGS